MRMLRICIFKFYQGLCLKLKNSWYKNIKYIYIMKIVYLFNKFFITKEKVGWVLKYQNSLRSLFVLYDLKKCISVNSTLQNQFVG